MIMTVYLLIVRPERQVIRDGSDDYIDAGEVVEMEGNPVTVSAKITPIMKHLDLRYSVHNLVHLIIGLITITVYLMVMDSVKI